MIELRAAVVRAGDFTLGPLSFGIAKGEHVALLGASGAGKSLTLELVAGFRAAASGSVVLRGAGADGTPPARRSVGWVPQNHGLFPHLEVAANLDYGLRARRVARVERQRRVQAIAERLGIAPLLSRRPPSLSGGERQRVALGRALVTGCDVLLLDEPFAALEPGRRAQLWDLLGELRRDYGLTVLHATHEVQRALALGRVVALAEGKVVHDGGAPDAATLATLGLDDRAAVR